MDSDSNKSMYRNNSVRSAEEIPLRRALNLAQTTFLGVGTAICGTIFAIMGKAVEAAGPSIVITFLIGAFFALFTCFSYAELGSTVPSSAGGAISFVKRAFGETIPAFLAGWFDWIGSITDCALGAIVFAFSINYFLKWLEPYILAIIVLIVFALINFRGVKTMGVAEFILTAILVSSLSAYIVGSFLSFKIERFQPFFPKGFLPTILMVGYIFPTYAGYETITQLSEEVKTAGKTIPRALFLSLMIITIIFTGTAVATIGGAPAEVYVGSNTPLQDAANYFMGAAGVIVVTVGSMIATLSTINGSMAGATRIAYALSRSNLLPPFFKRVHPRYRTPYTSLALTTIIAIAFVLTRSVDLIVYVIALGYNVTAILVALSLIRLRKSEPHLYRPFKVPLYPFTTIMAVLTSIIMILTLSIESLILGVAFGFAGVCILILLRKTYKSTGRKEN